MTLAAGILRSFVLESSPSILIMGFAFTTNHNLKFPVKGMNSSQVLNSVFFSRSKTIFFCDAGKVLWCIASGRASECMARRINIPFRPRWSADMVMWYLLCSQEWRYHSRKSRTHGQQPWYRPRRCFSFCVETIWAFLANATLNDVWGHLSLRAVCDNASQNAFPDATAKY